MSEKRVDYNQLRQLANEVGGSDLSSLQSAFKALEDAIGGLAASYEAQRATDLIQQLRQIVSKVMSEVEPVCKDFNKVGSEEADYWQKFATSQAQITF